MTTPMFTGFRQHAYVATDIDKAMKTFDENYDVREFMVMRDIPDSEGHTMHLALAYAGDTMIELIQPSGDYPIYQCMLPADGFAIRLHHYGHFVDSDEQWQGIVDAVAKKNLPIPMKGDYNGLKFIYVDERDSLGHFLEYIYCSTPESGAMFANVPRN